MSLTESMQHYIKAIYEETQEKDAARVSDIAEMLDVSKASVSRAISTLEEDGLVARDTQRRATLTRSGMQEAISITDKHFLIEAFLIKVLRVSEDTANDDACALEHLLSNETLCSMANQLRKYMTPNAESCVLEECPWPVVPTEEG